MSEEYKIIDLLSGYYRDVYRKESEKSSCDGAPVFPAELRQPVEMRGSGIADALTRLIASGCGVNETDGSSSPLAVAVGNADAFMAGFLIGHGADASGAGSNDLLDDIDARLAEETASSDHDPEYISALRQTAEVLARSDSLRPYRGLCLGIDENGNVSTSEPPAKDAEDAAERPGVRKIANIIMIAVTTCVLFTVLLLTVLIPEIRLGRAKALIGSGKYEKAYSLLNGFDYKDSAEKASDCLFMLQKDRFAAPAVGSTVRFGSYEQDNDTSDGAEEIEWIVLDADGSKALLLSKYALDNKMFNDVYNPYVVSTWERSTLRPWLNGTFYDTAFGAKHKEMILSTEVSDDYCPDCSVTRGKQTTDNIFVLSVEEAFRYFDSDSERLCEGTAYCYGRGADKGEDGTCWWWLLSNGTEFFSNAVVTSRGAVFTAGFCCDNPNPAVRPAMWVDFGAN